MKKIFFYVLVFGLLFSCASNSERTIKLNPEANVSRDDVNKLYVVDCLLPGQVRSLGTSATYITPRRPIQTTAVDCEIRGGEYTAFDRADYATALKIWMPQARAGDPAAQTHVGEIYEKGMGVQPDYEMAAVWYKRAAKQGYSRAQIDLGYLYEKGLGVQQDLAKAMNYYRLASGLPKSITYVSTVELSSQKAQLKSLKEKVKELEIKAEKYHKQLDDAQKKLKNAQNRETSSKSQASKLQAQIASLKDSLKEAQVKGQNTVIIKEAPSSHVATTTQQAMPPKAVEALISKLFAQLKQKQEDIKQQGLLIAQLHKESAGFRGEIAKVEQQKLAMSAPEIQILDPPLALTRGRPSMLFRSASVSNVIYGKVDAPAGIKTFTYNDRKIFLRPDNSFKIPVDFKTRSVNVTLKATDLNDKSTVLQFVVSLPAKGSMELVKANNAKLINTLHGIDIGSYYALIIGNDDYKHLPNLKTAVNDAKSVDQLLRTKYGFRTTLLINADRYDILSAFNKLRLTLGKDTNLLVYYAGHGDLDKINDRGYWLPVDADADNPANWISNVAITDILNTLPSKHIMVIADSCYSGTMTQTSIPRIQEDIPLTVKTRWIKLMSKSHSRTVLSSGGVQPVLDEGGGGHSIFAKAFISALKNNDDVLQGYTLYREVSRDVSLGSANIQTPEYAPIRNAGHITGQFFFVPKKT